MDDIILFEEFLLEFEKKKENILDFDSLVKNFGEELIKNTVTEGLVLILLSNSKKRVALTTLGKEFQKMAVKNFAAGEN